MSARRLGRALAGGGKGSAISGLSGVATYFTHKLLASKVELAAKHPIAVPIALAGLGHFVKRKMPNVGSAIIGAGGYALGLALDVRRATQQNQTQALVDPSNVAALNAPGDVGNYVIPDASEAAAFVDDDVDVSEAMNLGMD